MANQGYMTMTGERQGLISAGCSAQDSIGNKCQTAHLDEIQVLSLVHDMAQVDNSPHASHGPIVITKNIDKSTPLLAQALDQRENLKCVLDFYRVSAYGNQEKFYTVELRGAVIVSLSTTIPHSILENDLEAEEVVAIRYRDILWTHHLAGTSGYASWSGEE
jgi:type VI secretion system Hcp family effector